MQSIQDNQQPYQLELEILSVIDLKKALISEERIYVPDNFVLIRTDKRGTKVNIWSKLIELRPCGLTSARPLWYKFICPGTLYLYHTPQRKKILIQVFLQITMETPGCVD